MTHSSGVVSGEVLGYFYTEVAQWRVPSGQPIDEFGHKERSVASS